MALVDGGPGVAQARPATVDVDVPNPVSVVEAERGGARYPWRHRHPYPTCFVCGPQRVAGDGLCIFPGPVEGRSLFAAPWTPDRTLIDLFCGSGTIAIEAALIAQNMAPGLKRSFAFQKWSWIEPDKIKEAYAEARLLTKIETRFKSYSFDIDPGVLVVAEDNARHAGFQNMNFKRADFNDLDFSQFENCTFIANPPYGERLEDQTRAEEMYRKLGEKLRQTKNCSFFLITSNENFPQLFGRPADKNRKLFNGGIRCYLFSFLK